MHRCKVAKGLVAQMIKSRYPHSRFCVQIPSPFIVCVKKKKRVRKGFFGVDMILTAQTK